MAHTIELANNMAIVQVVTRAGKLFRLLEKHPGTNSELLDEKKTAEEILLSAERFQGASRISE